ncbi:unnamed protein product [Aphanomyces euteiches]|nr:hypothetical protein Ae201684P_021850 [Aphanomyces euteiches]KAH9133116.1 hypothetical protein AeRB84_020728 [Aphanomyces euteiches]
MGQAESASDKTAASNGWPLARRVDTRWSRMTMEQLFDEEYLAKQYRRTGFAQQATSRRPGFKSDFQDPSAHISKILLHDDSEDDNDAALAETIMALVDYDPVGLAKFSLERLRHSLVAHCESVDPFMTKVELQQYLLRGIHTSLSSRLPSMLSKESSLACDPNNASSSSSSSRLKCPSHEAALGVQVFLSLVRTLTHDPSNRSDRKEFLTDVIRCMEQLAPLALAWKQDVPSSCFEIVDALQQLLVDICVDDNDNATKAMNALLRLAVARGSVSTFLVAVQVLLGVTATTTTATRPPKESPKVLNRPSKIVLRPTTTPSSSSSVLLNRGDSTLHEELVVLKKKPPPKQPGTLHHPVHPLSTLLPSPKKNNATIVDRVGVKFHPLDVQAVLNVLAKVVRDANATGDNSINSMDDEDDDEREVWSCGQNSYGELSHGDTTPRKSFERVEALQGKAIVQVCAGNEHTVALAADGAVFTCGYNDNGQCGHGVTTRIANMTELTKLDHPVGHIHAYNGCEHTIVVSTDGLSVASFGYNYRGQLGHGSTTSESLPKRLRGLPEQRKVHFVSCSYYHSLLSCSHDNAMTEVYAFGRNDYGQLGLNDTLDRRLPTLVDALTNIPLTSLACGQYHSVATTQAGGILAFGKNDYGQLGVESVENQLVPVAVPTPIDAIDVRCGYYHTIVLCRGAKVYSFGRNDYGQLGVGESSHRLATAVPIEELDGKAIVRIACGCYHTVAVAESGLLYVFGRNNHGQLGTGDTTERLTPFPVDTFVGKRVAMVAAGFYHTIVLTGGHDEKPPPPRDATSSAVAGTAATTSSNWMPPFLEKKRKSMDPTVDDDNNVDDGNEAAVYVLAHLDRLCRGFIPPKGSYPVLAKKESKKGTPATSAASTATTASVTNSYQAYCVDVQSSTFDALNHILDHFLETPPSPPPPSGLEQVSTHVYVVLAALRLVQANLTQLIRCGLGHAVVHEPAKQQDLLQQLKKLNGILVRWINGAKWLADHHHATMVTDEAVEALLLGLELFYPCPSSQTHLIFSILKDATTPSSLSFPSTIVCSTCHSHEIFVPKQRKVLLEPLLRRMADDNLLVQFLRHDPNNTANIKGLVSVLLDKISTSTDAMLTKRASKETATFRPYIILLNAVQKHVASWAGSTTTWSSSLAAALKIDGHELDHVPLSWRCFLEYCMIVVEHAIENAKAVAMLAVLDVAALPGALNVLEASLLGAVVPSLTTTLLLFRQHPLYAITLLPLVKELLRLVDGLNQHVPDVVQTNVHVLHSLPGTIDSVYKFPWLYALEKLLAQLAADLAATLVVADPLSSIQTPPGSTTSLVTDWCSHDLFAGGLEPRALVDMHGSTSRAVQHAPFGGMSSSVYPMASIALPLVHATTTATSTPSILPPLSILDGDDFTKFAQRVREVYAGRDSSYRFLLKPSRGRFQAVEVALFRALLKHSHLETDARIWTAAAPPTNATTVARVFLHQWALVAESTRTMAQLQNTWQNQLDGAPSNAEAYRADVIRRCVFLLSVAVGEPLPLSPPCDPPLPSGSAFSSLQSSNRIAQPGLLTRYPHSKWKRVRVLLHTCRRWRSLLKADAAPSQTQRDVVEFALAADISVDAMRTELLQHCRRASIRARGLDAFGDLVSYTRVTSMHATILHRLGNVLRQELNGRLLKHLEGAGHFYSSMVVVSFATLFSALSRMTEADHDAINHGPLLLACLQCWSVVVEPEWYCLMDELAIVPAIHNLQMQKKDQQTVQGALWAAFRYLVSSGTAAAMSPSASVLVPPCPQWNQALEALYTALHWSTEAIKSAAAMSTVSPTTVLTSSRSFSALDRGIQRPVVLAPAFTLRFWLFVAKKPDGGRQMLVSVSSHAKEWIPYICLVEGSDRDVLLEAGLRQHSFQESVQRHVPCKQWIHLAIAYDGVALVLYMNGQLETSKPIASLQLVDQPTPATLTLGKPDNQLDPTVCVTGFDGLLAQVDFDHGAQSPSAFCAEMDAGPPNPAMDRCCYQLAIVSLLLAHSSEGVAAFTASPKWFDLFFSLFHVGTFRVRQLLVRLFRQLLAYIEPTSMASSWTLTSSLSPMSLAVIPQWIRTIGLCVVPTTTSSTASTDKSCSSSNYLAVELSHMLMHLVRQPRWSVAIHDSLADALALSRRGGIDDASELAQIIGSFYALGGFVDELRVGAVVELTQGKDVATVVSYHPPFAQLVVHKKDSPTRPSSYREWADAVHGIGASTEFGKPVRLNVEELTVTSRAMLSDSNWSLLLEALHALLTADASASSSLSLDGHVKSSALKALVNGLHEPTRALAVSGSLLAVLMTLATQSDGSTQFTTLAELEMKACMVRKRLYEMGESQTLGRKRKPTLAPEQVDEDNSSGDFSVSPIVVDAPPPSSIACDDENDEDDDEEEDEDEDEDDEDDEENDEQVRSEFVEELSLMGFPEDWCIMALKHTENDILSASAWIVDNLEYLNTLQAVKDKEDNSKEAMFNDEEDDDDRGVTSQTSMQLATDLAGDDDAKETGRKVFGEMYFPFDEGGYLSNMPSLFMTTKTNHQATAVSPSAETILHFTSELNNAAAVADVVALSLKLEGALQIQYCRQAVALWCMASASSVADAFDENHERFILPFAKSVLFRGNLFSMEILPDIVLADVVDALLTARLLRFGHLVWSTIVHELTSACDKKYEGVLWTQRDLASGDARALDEPSVEYASWLVECFFSKSTRLAEFVDAAGTETHCQLVAQLVPCLLSSNVALKLVVMSTLTRLIRVKTDTSALLNQDALLVVARRRHLREVSQNRLYYSPYLQGLLELIRALPPSTCPEFSLRVVRSTDKSLALTWPASVDSHVLRQIDPPSTAADDIVYSGSDHQYTLLNLTPQTSYTFALESTSHSTTTTATFSTKPSDRQDACPPFSWDKKKCRSGSLVFADDGLGVSFNGNETWRMVLGTECFVVGKHRWEIKVEKASSAYLFVGVASRRANLESFLGADEHSWGFIGDGALYYQRNRVKTYGEPFGEGDVIGLDLDCDLGTLSYTKNGQSLGVAFDNVVGELCPAVAFYSRHQKVSLVSAGFDVNLGLKLHGSPTEATVDEYLDVCAFMEALHQSVKLPPSILARAYDGYLQWWNETRCRVMTRAGYDLLFDVSDATCIPFGFKAKDKVKTPRGNGTVVGVADGRLWVDTEGETGVWFYHPSKIRLRGNVTSTPAAAMDPNGAADTPLSVDAFESLADCNQWSLAQDAKLVGILNCECGQTRISPWNVGHAKVRQLVATWAHVEAAVARVSVLKLFNHMLSRTMPFFDLTWHYFAPTRGLTNAALLAATRGYVFAALKHRVVDSLLEKTLTHPKKAEDDYDYPEDLPQVMVNRPKAAVAHLKRDIETVVTQSLFGQAFDELHFLETKVLRMVYSHPMDDGQLRTFKVKFEGEGADDYGGPYREFFAQFAAELQSVKPDSLECTLPFLIPSPNWRNAMGTSREKFVLNPSLLSPDSKWNQAVDRSALFLEMYHFLGQMLGILFRTRVLVRLDFATSIWKQLVGTPLDLMDLAEVDAATYSLILQLRRLEPSTATATLAALDLTFTTYLSDGTLVPLVPDGHNIAVTADNVAEYVERVITTRLSEGKAAIEAIKQGLCTIIPANAIALYTADELETRICGRADVDVTLLQANTEYDEDVSADDAFVQRFWRVLHGMSQEDRVAFLRFVSARSRLPMDQQTFGQKFKIQAASGEGMTQNPDDSLPKSHTCFFALLLPKYSSDDICRKQFLYAIHNCLEMDGDFRLADTEMTGWSDINPNDALRI